MEQGATIEEPPACKLCGKPVIVNQDRYDVLEQMHWLCFHLVYEHHTDADQPCTDPSCPWWHLEVYRGKLNDLGHDPGEVISLAIAERVEEEYGS